jgi:hypothetical protein
LVYIFFNALTPILTSESEQEKRARESSQRIRKADEDQRKRKRS